MARQIKESKWITIPDDDTKFLMKPVSQKILTKYSKPAKTIAENFDDGIKIVAEHMLDWNCLDADGKSKLKFNQENIAKILDQNKDIYDYLTEQLLSQLKLTKEQEKEKEKILKNLQKSADGEDPEAEKKSPAKSAKH